MTFQLKLALHKKHFQLLRIIYLFVAYLIANINPLTSMKNIFIAFIVMFAVSSCATGSYILTGQKREPIDPAQVLLYTTPPTKYDVIGIVNASSESGWTQQGDMDLAIAKLKKLAAKLGANGVLISVTGESTSSTVGGYNNGFMYNVTTTAQTVTGQAIYVAQ